MDREPDPDVATAMEVAALCKRLQCLPQAGGLFDQDSRDVFMLTHAFAAMDERDEREAKKQRR